MRTLFPSIPLLLVACGETTPTPAASLDFLVGAWENTETGVRVEERWRALPDGDLLGAGAVGPDRALISAESMAIVTQDGKLALVTWPSGADATVYLEVERTRTSVTFANDVPVFPKKITYTRTAQDTLEARAVGARPDGAAREDAWTLTRAATAP